MLNIPIIYKALGTLLLLEALLLGLCFGMGFYFGEVNHLTFGLPSALAAVIGACCSTLGAMPKTAWGGATGF